MTVFHSTQPSFAVPRPEHKRPAASFGAFLFSEAVEYWLNGRHSISVATRRDYRNCIKNLVPAFGLLPLVDIRIEDIERYQQTRRTAVGAVRINREIGVVLGGTLERAGLWEEIKRFYEPLPLPKTKRGIALEPEEERHIWQIAAANPHWKVVYWCSLLARNTCMGTNEIRQLKMGAIDQKDFLWVRVQEGLKNAYRERTLRCNPDAAWALRNLAERAAQHGASLPDHYLLPHRSALGTRCQPDPTRPQATFLWSWRKLRKEVAKKFPRLATLRFYDNRHTACTRLLENPEIPYNAIEHMMGHEINSRTKRIYDEDNNYEKATYLLREGTQSVPELFPRRPRSSGTRGPRSGRTPGARARNVISLQHL
jgi:integrase